MKTIKTRNTIKNIKMIDKSASLSKRMKDASIRTRNRAKETQDSHHDTPTEYASENMQDVAHSSVYTLSNPRQKAREHWSRAKEHLREARQHLPKERNRAAEQTQKTAHKAKSKAETLRKTADQAGETARETKAAVKDAQQTLRNVRQTGRQTLREFKQGTRVEPGGTVNPGASRWRNMPKGNHANPAPPGARSAESAVKSTKTQVKQASKAAVKTTRKSIKTAEHSAKAIVKTAQQAARNAQTTATATAKAARTAEHAARVAAKAATRTTKIAAKTVTTMAKAALAALQGLTAALIAGGWAVVSIVLIICIIALMVSSVFGIFFSGEPSASGKTINSVIAEIDAEYTDRLNEIAASNPHDQLDMSGARASWKDVLAVYTVKTTGDPDNPMEVATVDDERAALLRAVFWEMNIISYTLDRIRTTEDVIGADGAPTGETTSSTTIVLRITVSHKTTAEMAAQYGFSARQIAQLEELLLPEYHPLWNALLYGIARIGDGSMIETALTQLGNVGGEPYWRWYGLSSRVEWCAIFVSWVAEQCGYIESGAIPKFASCAVGIQWFKNRGQWQTRSYTPSAGDLIFFDWELDGVCDHVGIVESVGGGRVNTIEGNSSDSVARRSYDLGSGKIFGYACPAY